MFICSHINWVAIEAISNIFVVIVALFSLRYSYHQWKEDKRGRVLFSIEYYKGAYFLRIDNIGERTVFNLGFTINKEFMNLLKEFLRKNEQNPCNDILEWLNKFINKKISIIPHGFRRYYLATSNINEDNLINKEIIINGSYIVGEKRYKINDSFTINEFTGNMVVKSENKIETSLENISNSLKNIAKNKDS